MRIPDEVAHILQKLEKTGFSAYIVGGCVRDSIMGAAPKDWDIATSARPEEVKILFPKTYDTGLKHGTITVLFNDRRYEVTTFRIDGEYKDFRRPESVTYSSKIEDDLKRRDFTINAIAYNTKEGYIDPFEGVKDISEKLIRGVGNASERFQEDALRMLRAVRFAANLGFCIEESTASAIIENKALIENISAERICAELFAMLLAPSLETIFTKEFISLMEHISKPLAQSIALNKESLSRLLEDCKKNEALRLATLIYYLNNEDAEAFLKKLKLSNKMYDRVSKLHRVQNERIGCEYCDVAGKINEWGLQTFEDYLYIQMLDCIANDADLDYVLKIEQHFMLITENNLPVFIKDLALNGYDLNIEFKITGKLIGKTLQSLLRFVHQNPYKNTYQQLLSESYSLITQFPQN